MSTPEDRLDAIQAIYSDALDNEPADLSQATTEALVTGVQANVASARHTYYAAVAEALTNNSTQVEAAFAAAKTALTAVQTARSESAKMADLLGKLNSATNAGTNLLNAAKTI
jgi:hypothetical protein